MVFPYPATVQRVRTRGGNVGKMRATIRMIGRAIRASSVYPPIRNHAAMVAARAAPKDFLGQLEQIYSDFIKRWRYVRDPLSKELITSSPEAVWRLVLAGDGVGLGEGVGGGDCDCATVALGAELEATGFPIRITTTADRAARPGPLFGHVFIQAHVPQVGWITVDPVLHPKKKMGDTTNYSRIAYWDLDGRLHRARGNVRGLHGDDMPGQYLPAVNQWQDVGFGYAGEDYEEPADWSAVGPMGFGQYVGMMGIIDGSALAGIGVEVDDEEIEDWGGGVGAVRTPMLEIAPDDYLYMSFCGAPYDGMLAFGDTGELYQYDGTLGRGFFRKLFRKAKKAVRKVRKRVKRGIKKVLKKSRFGRALLKIGGKIKRIAMKVVKPLMKFVGKWASKLAPIAAMIPGYGTAIAAGLAAAGKVAKLMTKFGVATKGIKGAVRGLKLKNPKKLPAFQRALKSEASRMKKYKTRHPKHFEEMLASQKRRLAA
jgi:hypothetical protein